MVIKVERIDADMLRFFYKAMLGAPLGNAVTAED